MKRFVLSVISCLLLLTSSVKETNAADGSLFIYNNTILNLNSSTFFYPSPITPTPVPTPSALVLQYLFGDNPTTLQTRLIFHKQFLFLYPLYNSIAIISFDFTLINLFNCFFNPF